MSTVPCALTMRFSFLCVGQAVTTTPDTLVSSLLDSFQHFTGLPVVDEKGHCIGIISSVDIFEHQRKASPSITDVKVK